ncbi:MAG: hypothetical protein WCJ30_28020, partial [Deltaproteobacteria bacterium]
MFSSLRAAALLLAGCAVSTCGATGQNRPAGPLVIQRPEPVDAPASVSPPAEGARPLRAWSRAAGALLGFEHVAQ